MDTPSEQDTSHELELPEAIRLRLPTKSYIVCSTGRSGSTLLCSTLAGLNVCGKPTEYFHPKWIGDRNLDGDRDAFIDYFAHHVLDEGATENGIFGIKLHESLLRVFLRLARKHFNLTDAGDVEVLNTFFPNTRFIYIWRRDTVRQAISTDIAAQTSVWRQAKGKSTTYEQKPSFHPIRIHDYKEGIEFRNRKWIDFFNHYQLDYHEVVYEDFVDDFKGTILNTVHHIDPSLQVPESAIVMHLRKQANYLNEKWYRYYHYTRPFFPVYFFLRKIYRGVIKK